MEECLLTLVIVFFFCFLVGSILSFFDKVKEIRETKELTAIARVVGVYRGRGNLLK